MKTAIQSCAATAYTKSTQETLIMNRTFRFALAGFLLIASSAWAGGDEGAALYKKKCAAFHGANAKVKAALKAPALKWSTRTRTN
jgi:mono/diheme cytochrome c family protein